MAAVDLLRRHAPDLKVRVINVVNLMKLQPPSEHPHGLSDHDFDALFTTDKPIIFAFHGYPSLIHRLTYRRTGHRNLHVRGYKEEGTTSTPFDMCVLNDLDRFHLVSDVIDRVPNLGARAAYAKQAIRDKLIEHKEYICPVRRRHAGDHRLEMGAGGGFRGAPLDGSRQRLTRQEASMNVFAIRHGETAWSLGGQHTRTTDIDRQWERRLVFEPYTKEAHTQIRAWIAERDIFAEPEWARPATAIPSSSVKGA